MVFPKGKLENRKPRDALLPQQNGESRMNNDRRILDYTPFCIQFCGVLGILE